MPPWTIEELTPIGGLRQYRIYRYVPPNPPGSIAVYHWSGWQVRYLRESHYTGDPAGPMALYCLDHDFRANAGYDCEHVAVVRELMSRQPVPSLAGDGRDDLWYAEGD